ncbi:MAG: hypothetical protein DLM57_04290 [Pseudonocardiales bacterium]|nr:MAG: hypothetical protein DLM57_04290 [Pseudonocardiales bacterium]
MITHTTRHPLVTDYLHRLDSALADAPRPAARELHDQIAMHLDDAIGPDASELEVRAALDQFGGAEELAAEITPPRQPVRRARWVDVTALLLISLGSLVLPVIGWLAGAVLLASSPRFTRRQKTVGVLVWPLGLLLPAAALEVASGFSLPPTLGLPLAVLAIALPLGVIIWLAGSLKA